MSNSELELEGLNKIRIWKDKKGYKTNLEEKGTGSWDIRDMDGNLSGRKMREQKQQEGF